MKRLGQILLEQGWVTPEQLLRALNHQKLVGGRLGTCLLEMEAVEERLLLRALALQLGVPAAEAEDLRGVPDEVIELLPAKVARRCQAVPFRVLGGQLHVALLGVRDLAIQDELAFVSGKRLRVHIANEARIFEALEKYYSEECPQRFAQLIDRINRARYLWNQGPREAPAQPTEPPLGSPWELPPAKATPAPARSAQPTPPEPGLAPAPSQALQAPPSLPATSPGAKGEMPAPTPAREARPKVEPPAVPRVEPTPQPVGRQEAMPPPVPPPGVPAPPRPTPAKSPEPPAPPRLAPPKAPPGRPAPPGLAPAKPSDAGTLPRLPPAEAPAVPLAPRPVVAPGFEEIERRLLDPSNRDEVGAALLDYLAPRFRRVLLLGLKKEEASGWMGRGEELDLERFREFRAPLAQPSLFATLRDGAQVFRGPVPALPIHRELANLWGGKLASDALVLPIAVRGRPAALLYLDNELDPLGPFDSGELQRLVARAGIALETCIRRQKARQA